MPLRFLRHAFALLVASATSAPLLAQTPHLGQLYELRVVFVAPSANATFAPRNADVLVRFNNPLVNTSVAPSDLHLFGSSSGPIPFTLHVEDRGRTLRLDPLAPFAAGERVDVVVSKHFRGIGRTRTDAGFAWSFRTASSAGNLNWPLVLTLATGSAPVALIGTDLDADGLPDLSVANDSSGDVSVFVNNGLGYDPPTAFASSSRPNAIASADLDLDGDADLVVANTNANNVSILLGNGDGTFASAVTYPVGSEPRGVALLDVNGDGDLDVVAANRQSNDLSLLRNLGDGTFASEARFDGGVSGESSCAAVDMNGDGRTDLVVAGTWSDSARTLFGDGHGDFLAGPLVSVGDQPVEIVAGDVDGDGDADVALALAGSSAAVEVCLNDGTGKLSPGARYPIGSFTTSVALGDLNADGQLDLAGTSFFGATFRLYRNLGGGAFGDRIDLPAQNAASSAMIQDVDGDGDVDVVGLDDIANKAFVFVQPN